MYCYTPVAGSQPMEPQKGVANEAQQSLAQPIPQAFHVLGQAQRRDGLV